MVLEVPADPCRVDLDFDAHLTQVLTRADSGEHQELR